MGTCSQKVPVAVLDVVTPGLEPVMTISNTNGDVYSDTRTPVGASYTGTGGNDAHGPGQLFLC